MISHFTVFFDANVFYPAVLRDLLLELAAAHLFRAKWSEKVHEEWIENLLQNDPKYKRESLERTKLLAN